jgi:uncharacterized phage protein gp47/JayE
MPHITNSGLVIDQIEEIHTRLVGGFKRIYGNDINIDADTPDGQMIGIFSQALSDINEALQFAYQMLDPYRATGEWLEQRSLYAGVIRRKAEYSYIEGAEVSGQNGVKIPAGTIFSDENKAKWITEENVIINSSNALNLRSAELGAFELPEKSVLKMETVILGVASVTLRSAAKTGVKEETDSQLLQRFMASHSINNYDDRDGIEAMIRSVPDVRKAKVLENYTSSTDENSVAPHTVNAVVLGGTDVDIAKAIIKKKIGGAGLQGAHKVALFYNGAHRQVEFDRAQKIDVILVVILGRLQGFNDVDTTSIINRLTGLELNIGEDVHALSLACKIESGSGYFIKSIKINGTDTVEVGVRQYANIVKTEVYIE